MNPGVFSVKYNRVVFVAMAMAVMGGFIAYLNLGRLEDPEFTIKQALIITPYPGASAEEVAVEVTNPIERAVQQLGQLDRVESESLRGSSVVIARIKDRYHKDAIPQVWDELRRRSKTSNQHCPPRSVPSRWLSTISERSSASSWLFRATDTLFRNSAATLSSCAARSYWSRASRVSSSSARNRRPFSWKSRDHGWRNSASMRSRSTRNSKRRTSPPT